MNFEQKGGAVGFGVGAGLMGYIHLRVAAHLYGAYKAEKAAGRLPEPPEPEVDLFTVEGLELMAEFIYTMSFPVGSVIVGGLVGYAVGTRIGSAIDNKLAPL